MVIKHWCGTKWKTPDQTYWIQIEYCTPLTNSYKSEYMFSKIEIRTIDRIPQIQTQIWLFESWIPNWTSSISHESKHCSSTIGLRDPNRNILKIRVWFTNYSHTSALLEMVDTPIGPIVLLVQLKKVKNSAVMSMKRNIKVLTHRPTVVWSL